MRISRLTAGVSAIALWAAAAQAQNAASAPIGAPVAPTGEGQAANERPAGDRAAEAAQPSPPRIFRDAQGNPLPPDIQRQIEERLRATPPASEGAPSASDTSDQEVVVTGDRPRGSVIGDVPAERSFDTFGVRAFGATDVSELLDAIAPQVRSNRGRADDGPVTLLNGRRVSSFAEIARIPTEAIERMDVFPEELALRYGFRADQKVVNIVTFANFRSVVTQAIATAPTDGGTATGGLAADQLVLQGDTRFGAGITFSATSALLERERDLLQIGSEAGAASSRTLIPRANRLSMNGVVGAPVTSEIGASLNAQFEGSDLSARLVSDSLGDAVGRETRNRRGRVGTVIDGRAGRWLWSLTGGYDRTSVDVLTDAAVFGGRRERARSVSQVADADVIASGPLFALPAGPVTASIGGGAGARDFRGTSDREDGSGPTRLARQRATARANIDLPITREGSSAIGSLAANVGVEMDRLSDVGTLTAVNAGLNWSPIPAVDLTASVTREEGAPDIEQLGAPTIVTPAARTFDFATGQTVEVSRTFGGNPNLIPDDRRVLRGGMVVRPVSGTDLSFSADYVDTRTDDPIANFPVPTQALESAFPARFERDTAGRLTAIDARPVNFAQSTLRQLRTGINFTRPLGDPLQGLPPGATVQTRVFSSQEEAAAYARRRYPSSNIVLASPEPGSAAARRGETLRSRFYVSLYHNWTLSDEVTLLSGGPVLSRLDGFATDLRGGRRRHEIDFQVGAFKGGLGGRLGVNWQSSTRIDGVGGSGLTFDPLSRVDLTLFLDPAEQLGGIRAPDWIKRTRVTLGITNLLNERPQVLDGTGTTPLAFQPAFLDPLGRSLTLTLRKRF